MHLFRSLIVILIFIPILLISPPSTEALTEKQSIIIEVDGDPKEHEKYLKIYHPFVEVVAVYDQLFNGLALQSSASKLTKVVKLDFIKNVHPVQTYEVLQSPIYEKALKEESSTVLPEHLNNTSFTGKGVKVGVIDTGVDYTHPDLAKNYVDGYDLVDLDDDPMETTPEEGMPTLHGTHVAGIIAADGEMKGVAPDAEIFAYRALGPGGMGTSIHIIAALEQAVKDGMDVVNLSLGNSVNGPDYPTSTAVNRAVDLGVAVVIASGNSGPEEWTVGSPATASKALAVGALALPESIPFLHDSVKDKEILLNLMSGSIPWELDKDYKVERLEEGPTNVNGKIALIKRSDIPFYELAKSAEEAGAVAAIIFDEEEEEFLGSIQTEENPVEIPVAAVSEKDGKWLVNQTERDQFYVQTTFKKTEVAVAPFSSRGPVTVNWDIKPDLLAPGTNILSTVPDGYAELQGTSMATPHVAGAIALIKEAHPKWSNEQIIGALKTTALRIENEENDAELPIQQGMGLINIEQAIDTDTIINHPLLSFGKIDTHKSTKQVEIDVENTSNIEQAFHFDLPKKKQGVQWDLPQAFYLKPGEKKTVKINLAVTSMLVEEGMHQGWLTLKQANHSYDLPFLFINKTADYPKAMGFDLTQDPFDEDLYAYQFYLSDEVASVDIHLYDPETLLHEQKILHLTDVKKGMNEGHIDKEVFLKEGNFKVILSILLENGDYDSIEGEVFVE